MRTFKYALAIAVFALTPLTLSAQEKKPKECYDPFEDYVCPPAVSSPQEEPKEHKTNHGTYLKFGIAHWQENIFGPSSLTNWKGNLFGSDYNLTSLNVEIETYFGHRHISLSGFSIGYRKDDLRYADSGHMFNGKAFWNGNLKIVEIKPAIGADWGMPSLNFDKTQFSWKDGYPLQYKHSYPIKNSNIPGFGTENDGAWYPFTELSLVERPGRVLIEAGMRVNIIKFGVDDYEVGVNHKLKFTPHNQNVLVPYLFVNIGVKMF